MVTAAASGRNDDETPGLVANPVISDIITIVKYTNRRRDNRSARAKRKNGMAQALLAGKVIIVTGAGGGVGRGIALELAREGARVVVNDLGGTVTGSGADGSAAQRVVDEIKASGGEAVASSDSVAGFEAGARIVQTALDAFGRIDGVVNNAGILRDTIFHKMSEQDFDSVLAVHLKGSFNLARHAAPYLKEQNGGAFVHMTSTSGLIGNFGQANYCAAKMGIVGLSKAIALDMARFKVRSNCIAPFAFTRMVGSIPTDTPEQQARMRVIERLKAEKIAPFVAALMSDDAADITGQIFGVRNNEIYLFTQPRPFRTAHTDEPGWTPQKIVDRVLPMFRPDLYKLDRSMDVFTWDPV
jgi:NAD(P)-dependent dehydrogenase (short-subunit alcohol dehydrogenase family)